MADLGHKAHTSRGGDRAKEVNDRVPCVNIVGTVPFRTVHLARKEPRLYGQMYRMKARNDLRGQQSSSRAAAAAAHSVRHTHTLDRRPALPFAPRVCESERTSKSERTRGPAAVCICCRPLHLLRRPPLPDSLRAAYSTYVRHALATRRSTGHLYARLRLKGGKQFLDARSLHFGSHARTHSHTRRP